MFQRRDERCNTIHYNIRTGVIQRLTRRSDPQIALVGRQRGKRRS
jgi:hypothetical protein